MRFCKLSDVLWRVNGHIRFPAPVWLTQSSFPFGTPTSKSRGNPDFQSGRAGKEKSKMGKSVLTCGNQTGTFHPGSTQAESWKTGVKTQAEEKLLQASPTEGSQLVSRSVEFHSLQLHGL